MISQELRKTTRHRSARAQSGVTLVEVLVTLVVTTVGLLGTAALQLSSLRNSVVSNTRSQASMLAADIIDRMRANRTAALATDYDITMAATAPATPSTRAENDKAEWLASLQQLLPAGDGSIAVDTTTRIATVTVQWDERGIGSVSFVTQTEM